MSRFRYMGSFLLLLGLLAVLSGCVQSHAAEQESRHVIGVAVYSFSDDEVRMFQQYYKNYIESNFPVTFVYSNAIRSAEDEQVFLSQAAEAGAEGIISFISYDLPAAVEFCSQQEIYYMMGSSTVSDEDFAAVQAEPYFLGVIGPDKQDEYQVGYEMAQRFAAQYGLADKQYVVISGGAAQGNAMHYYRAEGMLTALAEAYNLEYDRPIAEILLAGEPEEIAENIYLYPGYVRSDEFVAALGDVLQQRRANVVLDVMYAVEFLPAIEKAEQAMGQDILVGAVDCFSEHNYLAFEQGELDYLAGKYASLVGPAFAAMFNAVNGDAAFMREDGQAFRLHQGFWVAPSRDRFAELYARTQGVYVNAYSAADLQQVIRAYNPEATMQQLRELTEACDMESVRKRIEGQ